MGGNTSNFVHNWAKITFDKNILRLLESGIELSFNEFIPSNAPFEYKRNFHDTEIISKEIAKLLSKGVISPTNICQGDFFSNVFIKEKKDGHFRTILNLKYLNTYCETSHFKLESIKNATNLMREGCFMGSLDIQDAFYSIKVSTEHRKFLKFMFQNTAYQFNCMPNGYREAMRIFTKILKIPFAKLRKLGIETVVYVDDTLILGNTYEECLSNIEVTKSLLEGLGFFIHPQKSVLINVTYHHFIKINLTHTSTL